MQRWNIRSLFWGFSPAFPYLRGLPRALHAPRRASPRVRVAAGSVAIGGGYCGHLPGQRPGWLADRSAAPTAVLFDPQRDAPALLLPGDRVRFVSRMIEVLRAGLCDLVMDLGRPG